MSNYRCLFIILTKYLASRGQESAGIVTSEGKCSKYFNVVKGMGMISNIFNDEAIRRLKGTFKAIRPIHKLDGGFSVC